MARQKNYSSTLRQVIDGLNAATDNLKTFIDKELPDILADAESYREFKPVIEKIAAKKIPATVPADTGHADNEKKPGDLCKTCAEDKTSAQCGHDAAEFCTGFKQKTGKPPKVTRQKANARVKKVIEDEHKNESVSAANTSNQGNA